MPIGRRSSMTDSIDTRTPPGPSKIATAAQRHEHGEEIGRHDVALGAEHPLCEVERAEEGLVDVEAAAVANHHAAHARYERRRDADRLDRPCRPRRVQQEIAVPGVGPAELTASKRSRVLDAHDAFQRVARCGVLQGNELGVVAIPEGDLLRIAAGLADVRIQVVLGPGVERRLRRRPWVRRSG